MDAKHLQAYFERIGFTGEARPNLETLRSIQEYQIYSVPVENLDVLEGKLPLSLALDDLYEKVVVHHRGGLSFELAILFADVLETIGFGVQLIAAKHPRYGHDFDHAALMVEIPGEEGSWLVDVGFTECPRTVLLFDDRICQSDTRDAFTFRKDADSERYWQLIRQRDGREEVWYSFTLDAKRPEEFAEQCEWFCSNEKSRFTQGPFIFIERPEGRICLSMDTVTNTYTGEEIRPIINTRLERVAVLREIFGLEVQDEKSDGLHEEYVRVFAALGNDDLDGAVIEKAVSLALERKGHLRFGHIVNEAARRETTLSFPEYVGEVRAKIEGGVTCALEKMGVEEELFGGEVVVMGANRAIGATIDAPIGFVPDQVVERLVKPFDPDVVVCGTSGKSKFEAFVKGSVSDYLKKRLECEVVMVGTK